MNPRPSGYEPDELPDCSTPRRCGAVSVAQAIPRPQRAMSLFKRRPDLTARLEALEAALAAERADKEALTQRLDAVETAQRESTERVDARVGELSTAMNDQLREVSNEIDGGRKRVDEKLAAADSLTAGRLAAFRAELDRLAADDGRLDAVAEKQIRLANELARHEIALREELAAVADRLTRQRPNR